MLEALHPDFITAIIHIHVDKDKAGIVGPQNVLLDK